MVYDCLTNIVPHALPEEMGVFISIGSEHLSRKSLGIEAEKMGSREHAKRRGVNVSATCVHGELLQACFINRR